MFRAPLDLAFPDGTLPAMNDCWYHIGLTGEVGHGIPDAAGFYEMAYGWYGDPDFGWVVRENLRRGPRFAMEAILDGVPRLPTGARPRTPSRWFESAGIAVLRSAARGPARPSADDVSRRASRVDRRIVGILKAGADGDAHGHPDQLGVQLFAEGRRLALDPGTPGYGIALNDRWYRQTASHSSLLVDSRSQPPGAGRITRFERLGDAQLTAAEVSWPTGSAFDAIVERAREVDLAGRAVGGVRRRRDAALAAGGARLRGGRGNGGGADPTDDRLALARTGRPDGGRGARRSRAPWPAPCGYDVVSDVRSIAAPADAPLSWRFDDARVDAWFAPNRGEQLFVASAPGNPAADRHDLIVRRVASTRAMFAAVIAPAGNRRRIQAVAWLRCRRRLTVSISTSAGTERWMIDRTGIRRPRR